MPVPLLVGWLSDRWGRKPFLYLAYLGTLASLAGLAVATSLWHFWAVMALGAAFGFGGAIGNALVTDLVPPAALARGLTLYTAATWLGGCSVTPARAYCCRAWGPFPRSSPAWVWCWRRWRC